MFRRVDKTKTERGQNVDKMNIDEVIESKIKECQRENGRLMICTANRLKEQYGNVIVNRKISTMSKRRYRGNKYQEKGTNEIMNLLKQLTNKKANQEQFSL